MSHFAIRALISVSKNWLGKNTTEGHHDHSHMNMNHEGKGQNLSDLKSKLINNFQV